MSHILLTHRKVAARFTVLAMMAAGAVGFGITQPVRALADVPPTLTQQAKVPSWKEAANAPEAKVSKKNKKKYAKIAQKKFDSYRTDDPAALAALKSSANGEESTSSVAAAPGFPKFSRYSICNPYNSRDFCTPLTYMRDYMNVAYDWSKAHTDKDERKPVPYPGAGTGQGGRWGFVYMITFRPQGFVGPQTITKQVWKFGETAQDDWATRAGVSLAQCTLSPKRTCDVDLVAVTQHNDGKYKARFVEASAVKRWNLLEADGTSNRGPWGAYGCPPGQKYSCR